MWSNKKPLNNGLKDLKFTFYFAKNCENSWEKHEIDRNVSNFYRKK